KLHEIELPQVKAARDAIGSDIALMCDTNCPWTVAQAIEMAHAFKPINLYWLEEPVWPPEDHAGLARVRQAGATIAAGENTAGLHDFRHMFEAGAIDIAQPSVTKIGGLGEMRRIADLAQSFGVRLVPHCAYFGPGFLASLHFAATLAHDVPFERLYVTLEASPFGPWLEAKGGKVAVPQTPGLGCDPDMAIVERSSARGSKRKAARSRSPKRPGSAAIRIWPLSSGIGPSRSTSPNNRVQPQMDLIIRSARLSNRLADGPLDIGVERGRIVAIERRLDTDCREH